MVGSLRVEGLTACVSFEGATDTEVFRTYVQEVLCPTLRPGDRVILDNLCPHKSEQTVCLIRQAGADVLFLPAYSPDLNPIEKMWSKVKASCAEPKPERRRRWAKRSVRLWRASRAKTR